MIKTSVKQVAPAGAGFPPQWRLAVSGRAHLWRPTDSGGSEGYRFLKKRGEAFIHYFLGTEARALECLNELAHQVAARSEQLDELEIPLLLWSQGKCSTG